jgi:hypothetical protein
MPARYRCDAGAVIAERPEIRGPSALLDPSNMHKLITFDTAGHKHITRRANAHLDTR